jgi:hypothetical protein
MNEFLVEFPWSTSNAGVWLAAWWQLENFSLEATVHQTEGDLFHEIDNVRVPNWFWALNNSKGFSTWGYLFVTYEANTQMDGLFAEAELCGSNCKRIKYKRNEFNFLKFRNIKSFFFDHYKINIMI